MLNNLKIENFRGIKELSLGDFSTVNVFVGRNGAGKTSVLEACGLAADPANANLLNSFSVWRELPGLQRGVVDGLRTLFPELDFNLVPTLHFETHSGSQSVRLSPTFGESVVRSVDSEDAPDASPPVTDADRITGYRLAYTDPSGNDMTAEVTLADQGFITKIPPQYRRELGTFFIHARRMTSARETAQFITDLYEHKREGTLIEQLKRVDNRVVRLQPGHRKRGQIILVDLGGSQMMPMNVLGDGFCRMCLMLTGVLWQDAKVTVVDEIDSGIHYTLMDPFWRGTSATLRRQGHQLFCATHSDEMLMNTIDAFENDPDALRIFRIERGADGRHSAKRFTYEEYKKAAMKGDEIR